MKRGRKALAFRLQHDAGEWVASKDLRGQRVVLFFYPKDDSSGCTVEVCEFRDPLPRFEEESVTVFEVWHETRFWGRKYAGVVRSMFVVDEDGRIAQEWRDVQRARNRATFSIL